MSREIYQQKDMFSGEVSVVGASKELPFYQVPMFPTSQMVELGANARPWLNKMPASALELAYQDIRTDEEKAGDLEQLAQALTEPMFGEELLTATRQVEQKVDGDDAALPVAWLSKTTLTNCRPDLAAHIQKLDVADMKLIASRVEEVLAQTYQMAVDIVLTEYLDKGEMDEDE